MFTIEFEKTAGFPGQEFSKRVGGRMLHGLGTVVGNFSKDTGTKLMAAGGKSIGEAADIHAGKLARETAANLETKNKLRAMQGKSAYKVNQQAIERASKLKAGKKYENILEGRPGGGPSNKKQNFVQKHPYVSLAGGMYAAHKMSQSSSGPEMERPQLGY
jgi:hypothetical protein